MRALLQRVTDAHVTVAGEVSGEIGQGLLVLLGVAQEDSESDVEKLAEKTLNYRVFADAEGKMNRSLLDTQGELLVVSQFTLCADTRSGLRPGFSAAAQPLRAEQLYQHFVCYCRNRVQRVETGQFGADMQVSLNNSGPVTFLLDTNSA